MSASFELAAERALPGLVARWTGTRPVVERGGGEERSDLCVRVGPHTLAAEVRRDASVASVEAALARLRRVAEGATPLVVVPYMTPAGAARCEAAGVAWADLSGNAHIEVRSPRGDLWVHASGQPNAFETRGRPRNAFAPKSARLARFLLAGPGGAWTQKEIAGATGLDPGNLSRLVRRLAEADLVDKDEDGRVVVPEPARLLDAWAAGNAHRHDVVTGHLPGRSGEDRARRLADVLDRGSVEYAYTGLAAAWAYTGAAGFRSVACYVAEPPPADCLRGAGFRADTQAPNARLLVPDDAGVLVGARDVNGLRCVAPAQAYVDLAREPERADEFAAALRALALHPPAP